MHALSRSARASGIVAAPPEPVFAYLDDHRNLSVHMEGGSWMMLGSSMDVYMDDGEARAVGSNFGFRGKLLGLRLSVDEVVTDRKPPALKVWETTGEPILWVIGRYRMGIELKPQGQDTALTVFINYTLPEAPPARWLGFLLGNFYARWCTGRMLKDAARHFATIGMEKSQAAQ
jgi:hypothetical protein